MNDAELLKLAAMAAGIDVWFPRMNGGRDESGGRIILEPCHKRDADGNVVEWNPLVNDGDAFRLAVGLNFRCVIGGHGFKGKNVWVELSAAHCIFGTVTEYLESDAEAATRRAIVRAAAEIGKQMEKPREVKPLVPCNCVGEVATRLCKNKNICSKVEAFNTGVSDE